MKFKSRREARNWCKAHHPGSPITEIGPAASANRQRATERAEAIGVRARPHLRAGKERRVATDAASRGCSPTGTLKTRARS
jgi:hypothetical protein